MKTYEIRISAQAETDLREVFEYIAYDLQSPQTAARQLSRLEERILGLEQMPERYRLYAKEPWRSRGLRIMPVDNYLVFYVPGLQVAVVHIMRVMHGSRDIEAQLQRLSY